MHKIQAKKNEEKRKLSQLNRGQCGKIVSVKAPLGIRRRLMDIGLIRGVEFEVIRKAPLGDPIEIKVHGFLLSLRINEADFIEIEIID